MLATFGNHYLIGHSKFHHLRRQDTLGTAASSFVAGKYQALQKTLNGSVASAFACPTRDAQYGNSPRYRQCSLGDNNQFPPCFAIQSLAR